MSKRKWTNIIAVEGLIIEMRKLGKTRQEIADALGLEKAQIKNWISRHNRKQAKNGGRSASKTSRTPTQARNVTAGVK
ncbi:MAG: hypothetical protein ACOX0K_08790 [Oscillospiraceae bacterium]